MSGGVAMEEICYVRGCKVVKHFVGGEENLEMYALFSYILQFFEE